MKNLLMIIALGLTFGLYSVQAQDPNAADRKADRNDKSKAGNVIQKTGNAVGSGAKWTWGKIKHNKVTKNVFNQPKDG